MGNCGRKIKRDVNGWVHKNNGGSARLSTPMHCPRCNHLFTSQTPHNTVNIHLDSCLNTQDSIILNQSVLSVANQPRVSSKISNNPITARYNEPFVWRKKSTSEKDFVWEKQRSMSSISDNDIGNLQKEEVEGLQFEDKQKWFRNSIEKFRIHWSQGADVLRVDRNDLLESSVKAIRRCNLFREVKVEFRGDEKVNDAGGLMREWMSLMIKELVRPDVGLFSKTDSDQISYTINPKSSDSVATLDMYEFAGKVVGKAIFERITLDIHFDDCFLKSLAGRDLVLDDLRSLDTPLYSSLLFLKQNTIGGSDLFEEYFVVPDNGQNTIELCADGVKKLVTDNNKDEYVQLLLEWYGRKRNQKKINAFINGMASSIPTDNLSIFEPNELEMLINGVPFIDIDDWESNTVYKGGYSRAHQTITWFWKYLHELKQEDLSKLLQFCTGSSRTPVEGFRVLESNRGSYAKFCIEGTNYIKGQSTITAHTCFNRLVLPTYMNEQALRDNLNNIIQTDFKGVFGLD